MDLNLDKYVGTLDEYTKGIELLWDMLPNSGKKICAKEFIRRDTSIHEEVEKYLMDDDNHDSLHLNSKVAMWLKNECTKNGTSIPDAVRKIAELVFTEDEVFYKRVLK